MEFGAIGIVISTLLPPPVMIDNTADRKWVEMTIPMDPLYLSVLISAQRKNFGVASNPAKLRTSSTPSRRELRMGSSPSS